MMGHLGRHDLCYFFGNDSYSGGRGQPMKRLGLAVIFAAVIEVALQMIGGAVVIGADDALQPLITTSELMVGQNRFAFGLAKRGKLIEHADVLVRLFDLEGTEAHLTAETNAPFRPVANPAPGKKVHRHADGSQHVHDDGNAVRGIYVAHLAFMQPGHWGVELVARQPDGLSETARLTILVRETPTTPAVGSPAPRSRNLIASDVKDLRQIDTSERPDPRLHQTRIADAIAMGKPQLIVFATPQFCTSRMCGPVVDIVRTLLPAYGKRLAFTHQEIWQDFATKRVSSTIEEWRLQSEPWIFIVDGQGMIRARFEGLVTARELETALQNVLLPETVPHR
jgi:hypothetical protein